MDQLLLLLAVVTAAAVFWYVKNRRRPEPPEDEWVLPPEEGQPSIPSATPEPPPRMVLDREALLHKDRTLDTSKWDNTPDELVGTDPVPPGAAAPEVSPGPRQVIDRSFLENKGKDTPELGDWGDE